MAINSVSLATPTVDTTEQTKLVNQKANTPYEAQKTFSETLKNAISAVNNQQIQSDEITNKLINGENVDLHEVMIAAEKANVTLNATVEVRNKVIEAYQEIMRMTL